MGVIVKVGVPLLILKVLLVVQLVAAQKQTKYFEINGKLVLRPKFTDTITSITWKHKSNLVAEWTGGDSVVEYLGDLKDRSELDRTTGTLTVSNMSKSDDGLFTVEINNKVHPETFKAVGLTNLNQSNIEIILRTLTCNSEATTCTLDCGGDDLKDAELQYFWKKGEAGQWGKEGEKKLDIINNEENRGFKSFTCKAKNPISEKESGPMENPFNSTPPGSNTGLVVGAVIGILFAGLVVVGLIFVYRFYKQNDGFRRAPTNSDGSPEQPAEDGKTTETEMVEKAAQRNKSFP